MIIEIISTGTELLLGQILNTNTPYLSQRLNELGFDVLFHSTVGDNRERMAQVFADAMKRADIVITSGGLGPTQGDITKEVSANLLGRPLELHLESQVRIENYFAKRNIMMPESNLRQAMAPLGAIVMDNQRGTAPGIILEHDGKIIIHLPGPPHELQGMFELSVVPYLQQRFPLQGVILSRILHTAGIGESTLEEKIKEFILEQSNPTIALLAGKGEVIIRLTCKGTTEQEAMDTIANLEQKIRQRVGEYIFGVDEDNIEVVLGKILQQKHLTVALAESCTGGLVSSRITDVAGSSNYFTGSIVCYSNQAKKEHLGVPEDVLAVHGAVSEQTAKLLAKGIRSRMFADIGMGITGIAGPGGERPDKPIGTVFIAVEGPNGLQCYKYNFSGQRSEIKLRASQAALDLLRKYALSCK